MNEIMEIWNAPGSDQLYYRWGDRFSKTRSLKRKKSETELYGEGYFYRDVMKEFGIPESEDLRVVSLHGEILWSS